LTFTQQKSKSKVKLNFGLSPDFSVQLKVSLSESLSERLRQKLKLPIMCVCSVNPITGRYEEPKPSPMEGMTEEQKEYEAIQLVNQLDKLQRWEHVHVLWVG